MSFNRTPPRVKQWDGDKLPAPRDPHGSYLMSAAKSAALLGKVRALVPILKDTPVRSEPYRRFVAQQACFGCGVEGFSQAAHPNRGKGLALKTCDLKCFPLCAPHFGLIGCHQQHDLRIDVGRDESREIEAAYVQRMQRISKAAGRKEFQQKKGLL